MNKRFIALVGSVVMLGGVFAAASCGKDKKADLTVAYLSGGRGETYVEKLLEEFEKTNYVKDYLKEKGKDKLETKIIKGGGEAIEDQVKQSINSGTTPDVLFLNFNMKYKLSQSFTKSKKLVKLNDLLKEKVYNEDATLESKLIPGLLENYTTKPYGGEDVYSLPAFYSPTGLWYDASRFNENGTDGKYKLPTTWAEFWALGDTLNTAITNNGGKVDGAHPTLFTYPTAGYFDGFIYSAVAGVAGEDKFLKMLGYEDGIWKDADVQKALEIVVNLRNYLEPSTVAQSGADFKKNQQAVIGSADGKTKGTALFIPNGDWLPGEMAESTPSGFTWGNMPLPAKDKDAKSYVNTFLENVYLHKDGANTELGKKFMLFYFSNEGAKIVAQETGAIIPTQAALTNAKANGVPDSTIAVYDLYDGNRPVSGSFVATDEVTGLNWNDILFNNLTDEVFNETHKNKTNAELLKTWTDKLEDASDKYRDKIIK